MRNYVGCQGKYGLAVSFLQPDQPDPFVPKLLISSTIVHEQTVMLIGKMDLCK
jgi:hypothetical protein